MPNSADRWSNHRVERSYVAVNRGSIAEQGFDYAEATPHSGPKVLF
ncbi:MAG TPA: hypothetical protein VIS29_17820 [Streptomyces sp.]|jgi:hypothetical protein